MEQAKPDQGRYFKYKINNFLRKYLKIEIKRAGNTAGGRIPNYVDPDFAEIHKKYSGETMVPWSGLYTAYRSINYICANKIPGAIIECGVWRGGCSAIMLEALVKNGETDRDIYLFDTFAGMTEPNEEEKHIAAGFDAKKVYNDTNRGDYTDWCYGPLDIVKANIEKTGYPMDKVHFVQGKVEETLPNDDIQDIAVLRLDTDWYESTLVELEHLYPKVTSKGVVIFDDYGTWSGAKRAVDEYFEAHHIKHLLQIDGNYGGACCIKA